MYNTILLVLFAVVVVLLISFIALLSYVTPERKHVVHRFDNTSVPYISPPSTIVIEGNQHLCHRQLTPCTSHMDCDLCREGLANCQYFDEPATIVMQDDEGNQREEHIEAGEAYCLALDRQRARSCNPNTGIWLLTESDVGFSLLCSCITPGIVTQVNMYEDCVVPVGCYPNGRIVDINARPIQCECDEGFVPEYNQATETPYCQPSLFRHMLNNPAFVPRPPCPRGYIHITHPALPTEYRQHFLTDQACVIDPCTVDPLTGERNIMNELRIDFNVHERVYCHCVSHLWSFPIYTESRTMLTSSSNPNAYQMTNMCISPFTNFNVNFEYRVFWGRLPHELSDDDIVATVRPSDVHERYRLALYPYLQFGLPTTQYPQQSHILKFSIAYSIDYNIPGQPTIHQAYHQLSYSLSSGAGCFIPGVGRCVRHHNSPCIRYHRRFVVEQTENATNDLCIFTRLSNRKIVCWHLAVSPQYGTDGFPIVFRVYGWFFMFPTRNDFTIMRIVRATNTAHNPRDLAQLMDTYPEYSYN
ncbi:ORF148 [Leucania separata nucleopolyhedrovirus]|uniref:ORF148 n=1 Tax=Leucania separata nucleopolyhedrovirus TaxID=1307956 RepID=Q0IKX1_NPVLS|nr:ORF148 [Leucania separata nucleopolyhedrovirus]AAR28912.1 ORF148 [Leucania separata nucleopolyhedrovirus]